MNSADATVVQAITRTLTVFAWGYDEADFDLVAGCFTEDATLQIAPDGDLIEGRALIRGTFESNRGARLAARQQTRHIVGNVLVHELGDDEVEVLSYLLLVVTDPDGRTESRTGWYRDRMTRHGDGWQIRSRWIDLDLAGRHRQTAFDTWTPVPANGDPIA